MKNENKLKCYQFSSLKGNCKCAHMRKKHNMVNDYSSGTLNNSFKVEHILGVRKKTVESF